MFAEKIGQPCSTLGTASYQLPVASTFTTHRTWRSGFATGAPAFYLATNDLGTVWEIGYGTFTTGSPDTLTRTLYASSSGALISWMTVPYRVYSVPTAAAMSALLNGGLGTSRPAWAPAGFGWLDHGLGLAVAWIKRRWTGSITIEEGRHHIAAGIFTPSPRAKWLDNGAANLVMNADHIGHVLLFDVTAAARTFELPAGAGTGFGHGWTCWVLGYGSTTNGLILDPLAGEAIDLDSVGVNATVPPNRLTRLTWDGAKSQWRTDRLQAPVKVQTFTASGTYTPLPGMTRCLIECIGGGGGGGGTATATATLGVGGAGGGAGGYSRKLCTAADIGASKAVTIGAAGSAGTSGNNAGGNGGDTSVGSLCIGKGGTGGGGSAGTSATVAGGAGGVAGTGDIAGVGESGASTGSYTNGLAVSRGGSTMLGNGGVSAAASGASYTSAGVAGSGYGAGGSGGISYNAGGAAAGGAGAAGIVIVTEYIG